MDKPTTMTVEQKACAIYPDVRDQFCVRLRVLVWPLVEGPDGTWIEGETPLRSLELNCSQRGLDRLLQKIDDGTKPPTPRPREAKGVVDVSNVKAAGDA